MKAAQEGLTDQEAVDARKGSVQGPGARQGEHGQVRGMSAERSSCCVLCREAELPVGPGVGR